MKREDAEEYTQSLGQVVAGGWRQIALGQRLGVPKALGLTVEQWVQGRLGGYVKLAVTERRPAVAALTTEGLSQRQVAAVLGVDEKTVRNDLTADNSAVEAITPGSGDGRAELSAPLDVIAGLAADEALRAEAGRDERRDQRRAERVEKINQANAGNVPLDTERPAPILYADPPWRYEHVKTESRAIENQYPTLSLEEICALPVAAAATSDAVLFLWATSPKLAEAFQALDAWGFTYRTCMVWAKNKIGMGYYARQQHELLLIATKGEPPVPLPENRPSSVVHAERGEHSKKPEIFYDLIERMYPEFEKNELFLRGPARKGWRGWGNQAE